MNKGFGNVYKRKTHRIWTGGAAPSSNPVSFSFVHISKALIHTVQNAYFSQKCCTYWEPDTTTRAPPERRDGHWKPIRTTWSGAAPVADRGEARGGEQREEQRRAGGMEQFFV